MKLNFFGLINNLVQKIGQQAVEDNTLLIDDYRLKYRTYSPDDIHYECQDAIKARSRRLP